MQQFIECIIGKFSRHLDIPLLKSISFMPNFVKNTLERHPKTILVGSSIVFLVALIFKYLNFVNEQNDWTFGFILGCLSVSIMVSIITLLKEKFN